MYIYNIYIYIIIYIYIYSQIGLFWLKRLPWENKDFKDNILRISCLHDNLKPLVQLAKLTRMLLLWFVQILTIKKTSLAMCNEKLLDYIHVSAFFPLH